jgi:uncharacterized damage-inducible protein DinB
MDEQALRKSLTDLLDGGQAYTPIEAALKGLKPGLRNVRPSEGLHSVYEEIAHMRIAQEDILRYALDAGWKSPPWPEGYWPRDNEGLTAERWEESVARFFADLEEVRVLSRDSGYDLTAPIPHGEGRTYLRQILLVADHNAYHTGQIVLTRKLLGNWG